MRQLSGDSDIHSFFQTEKADSRQWWRWEEGCGQLLQHTRIWEVAEDLWRDRWCEQGAARHQKRSCTNCRKSSELAFREQSGRHKCVWCWVWNRQLGNTTRSSGKILFSIDLIVSKQEDAIAHIIFQGGLTFLLKYVSILSICKEADFSKPAPEIMCWLTTYLCNAQVHHIKNYVAKCWLCTALMHRDHRQRYKCIQATLVLQGAAVSASDISSSMANEGQRRYEEAISKGSNPAKSPPTFSTSDLGSLSGSYDVVTCLDVMIHYPQVCLLNLPCILIAERNCFGSRWDAFEHRAAPHLKDCKWEHWCC